MAQCPSCENRVAFDAAQCPRCKAIFDYTGGGGWRPLAVDESEKRAEREQEWQAREREQQRLRQASGGKRGLEGTRVEEMPGGVRLLRPHGTFTMVVMAVTTLVMILIWAWIFLAVFPRMPELGKLKAFGSMAVSVLALWIVWQRFVVGMLPLTLRASGRLTRQFALWHRDTELGMPLLFMVQQRHLKANHADVEFYDLLAVGPEGQAPVASGTEPAMHALRAEAERLLSLQRR